MPIVIPYVKQTWIDNNVANPTSAARMGVLEEGILDVSQAPNARAVSNATQSIASGLVTQVALNLQTETYDQAGGVASTQHDNVTNNTRLTALYAGIYLVSAFCQFAANATGLRYLFIRKNGVTGYWTSFQLASASDKILNVSGQVDLAVNDYVEATVLQNSGAGLNVQAGAILAFSRVG